MCGVWWSNKFATKPTRANMIIVRKTFRACITGVHITVIENSAIVKNQRINSVAAHSHTKSYTHGDKLKRVSVNLYTVIPTVIPV